MRKPPRPSDGSEPPQAAVIFLIACIFGLPALAWLLGLFGVDWRSFLPWSMSENWYIVAIFVPLPLLVLVALVTKLLEVRRAESWKQTTGRIVKSEVEARHHQFAGEAETVKNVAAIEYEFSVGGKDYRGARIGIGDIGPNEIDATLAKYPVGKAVTISYDPAHPKNCVLEREVPKGVVSGCYLMLILAAAGIAGFYFAVTNAARLLAGKLPPDGNPRATMAFGCFGLAILAFFFAFGRYRRAAARWPSVPGKIVSSRVETYIKREDGRDVTHYAPQVEYAYAVNGQEYRSRQIRLGMAVEGTEAFAQKETARYPAGAEVVVHYDPENFSSAALEGPGGYPWIMLVAAAFCFAAAAYASGFFR
ncbi:MAG TPA: DUF3592 domain-containing protein [Xanthobacteraceae bacterium]|nr:DUF3592 domain-containing protein [Xanthobacteraceae bacterium]